MAPTIANPQLEDGYVKIANELFSALCKIRISGEARQVLDVIIRKTYGFNKKQDWIPLSQFVQLTGIPKDRVIRARNKLSKMNIIIVAQKDNGNGLTYQLNKRYKSWKPLPKKTTLPKKTICVAQKDNPSLPKKTPSKDNSSKDNVSKDIYAIKSEFNRICLAVPRIKTIDGDRRKRIRTLLKKYPDLDWWRGLFQRVQDSDWLTGRSARGSGWRADFDWILKEAKLRKILEGGYDNHNGNRPTKRNQGHTAGKDYGPPGEGHF